MKRNDPLRQILVQTRPYWDRSETRPAVRSAFAKALQCRTIELGAEVFASENEEQVFCHTCKSRPCSSCGYRATVQWQRELGRLARLRLQGNQPSPCPMCCGLYSMTILTWPRRSQRRPPKFSELAPAFVSGCALG
jgi:hypothetical protein